LRSVSRLQAQLSLGLDGVWNLRNTGRAPLAVNGHKVRRDSRLCNKGNSRLGVHGNGEARVGGWRRL
jgi:hypothetical protein